MARVILGASSIGAIVSFALATPVASAAPPEWRMVAVWQWYGPLVFTGLFALLAWRPRSFPGVWELSIAHKAALSVTAIALAAAAGPDGRTLAMVDGILAGLLIIAYLLGRAYLAWRPG